MQGATQGRSAHHGRIDLVVGVEQEVDGRQLGQLVTVEHPPLDKEGALVAAQYVFIEVIYTPVAGLAPAQPLLDLPASEIRINPHIPLGHQGGSATQHHDQSTLNRRHLGPQGRQLGGIEELTQLVRGQHAKHPILGDETLQHGKYLGLGQPGLFGLHQVQWTKGVNEPALELRQIHTVVAVDHQYPPTGPKLTDRFAQAQGYVRPALAGGIIKSLHLHFGELVVIGQPHRFHLRFTSHAVMERKINRLTIKAKLVNMINLAGFDPGGDSLRKARG
ncbi:hypothetical protein D3C71_1507530 [compost metagenome]